jgi:predicted TIM-barrel fold metal-dependent hydrolase
MPIHTRANFGPIFDADNHYWETSDAFIRYRDPKFRTRGLRVVEHKGLLRYFIGSAPHPILPGPGDVHPRPKPGALFDYFAGLVPHDNFLAELASEAPQDHPEWYDRDARLKTMDAQGIEASWMFPSHAVCIEGPMQPDTEASLHIIGAFNRWLHDDWGFAYENRIFGVPLLSLTDVEVAVQELEWVLERGARVITLRNGPAFTRDGLKSPADRMFDPFWGRVQEAGITATVHAGFDDGYRDVDLAVAKAWAVDVTGQSPTLLSRNANDYSGQFIAMLQKHRLVHDFAAALIVHGLFARFPKLRLAYIENGGTWVGPLLHDLQVAHVQNPAMFERNPVDQFHENCWVAPFVEDDVSELARHIPAERILFGSDWPHAEGIREPSDFFAKLDSFSAADVRKIMVENSRDLTYA